MLFVGLTTWGAAWSRWMTTSPATFSWRYFMRFSGLSTTAPTASGVTVPRTYRWRVAPAGTIRSAVPVPGVPISQTRDRSSIVGVPTTGDVPLAAEPAYAMPSGRTSVTTALRVSTWSGKSTVRR